MKLSKKSLRSVKIVLSCILLAVMLGFLVYVNVTEIAKGKAAYRTVAGSSFRNVTYFQNFSMDTFDGGTFTNNDFAGYKVIVVNVWEPYCSSCLKEMPELNELSKEYKDKGLLLVGVQGNAIQYPQDIQLGFDEIEPLDISFPMLLADQGFHDEVRPYLNDAFPGTWVLDEQGNILDFTASAKSRDAWAQYFDRFL